MDNKKEFIVRCYNGVGANISINITSGELSYVAHWGEREEVAHNLKKNPNWKHAEELIESICQFNREDFLNIVKELDKRSQGYDIIKRIAQKQIADCESQISKVKQEAEFWNKFL